MRAVSDNRAAEQVEGILNIRHVPSYNYAQVIVTADGYTKSVAPDSIEVLVPQEVSAEELERTDPLADEPGWRPLSDIAEANRAGLLPEPRQRLGGTWEDLFAGLAARAGPLLEAGWLLISTNSEESWEFGDSVFYDLEREGTMIELEYYEHGQLVAYRAEESEPDDPESASIFSLPESSKESAAEAFRAHGWL